MIERINLIEKEPFKFTYTKMMRGGGVVVAILIFIFGYQFVKGYLIQKDIEEKTIQISEMESERKKLLKTANKKIQISGSKLENIFINTPHWSKLVTEIGDNLPNSVWLSTLKASLRNPKSKPVEKDKEKDKGKKSKEDKQASQEEEKSKNTGLDINGTARDPEALTLFLNSLQKTKYLDNPVLISSKKQKTGYIFEMQCDIAPQL